jgi:hypothetical protein
MLSLEAVTNAPVDVGGRVTFEAPFRVRLSAGFGVVPSFYLGLVNGAIQRTGAYDMMFGQAGSGAYDGGSAWRAQIGVRPFKNSGFYIDGGYSMVNLSGRVAGPIVAGLPSVSLDLETRLHTWLIEIGFQGQVADRMVLGFGLGVLGTIAASTSASTSRTIATRAAKPIAQDAVSSFDRRIEQYGYVPTATLRVGYDLL